MLTLRFAVRSLRKSPGFTLVVILTLALGIGATTMIYSVVNAVLLRPLDYPQSEKLVAIYQTVGADRHQSGGSVSPVNYRDWRDQSHLFAELAAYRGSSFNLTGDREPRRVIGARATAGYWSVYGVAPALGRVFTADEDKPGADPVVLLSHAFWQQEFGGESSVVGHTIELNGRATTVIGVMPASFQRGSRAELWSPMAFAASELAETNRGSNYINVIGRLRDGVTIEQARSEIDAITAQIAREHPDVSRDTTAYTISLLEASVGSQRAPLYILLCSVGALLLIACVNIANLLLARATGRFREFSVRAALGATPAQLVRQLLGESLLLALVGGSLGVLVAVWGLDGMVAFAPADLPRIGDAKIDVPVLGAAIGTILLCGLGFGLVPAMQSARTNLVDAIKDGARSTGESPRRAWLRSSLVVAEIACTLTLLVVAGLLMRSFTRLVSTDPGFDAQNATYAALTLSPASYGTAARQAAFVELLTQRVATLPGVTAVGVVHSMPFSGAEWVQLAIVEGRPAVASVDRRDVGFYATDPGYFPAMGIQPIRGRIFTAQDRADAPPVIVVSQTYAQAEFPDQDPIGRRIAISNSDETVWREIVGVVRDVKQLSLDAQPQAQVYLPFAQASYSSVNLVVRTSGPQSGLAAALKREVHALDPNQPVNRITPVAELVAGSTTRQLFLNQLLGLFSGVAVLLAALGIYGVVAYNVSQRTAEYGVRLALGARPADLLRLVLGRSGRLVSAGVFAGLALALAAARILGSQLYATSPYDPLIFFGVAAGLVAVALCACLIPARRATKVDPMIALRSE